MSTDFSKLTACGGDCSGCERLHEGLCCGCNKNGGIQVSMWHNGCDICECCKNHNVKFCGLCDEFPCEWLKNTLTWHENGIEQLRKYADEYRERFNNVN